MRKRKYFTPEQKREAQRLASKRHYQKKKHGITKADTLSPEGQEALLKAFGPAVEKADSPQA